MQEQLKNNKILLHACCGICSAYSIQRLNELGYEVLVYFYNPNIYPEDEYLKRLEAQKTVCEYYDSEIFVEEYNHEEFLEISKGLEMEPEKGKRCLECFKLRLAQTAQKAKELNIEEITTSITISPHKNFTMISQLGVKIANAYGIRYLSEDFKKKDGFLKTNQISKELGLYRQNYCGCEFTVKIKD